MKHLKAAESKDFDTPPRVPGRPLSGLRARFPRKEAIPAYRVAILAAMDLRYLRFRNGDPLPALGGFSPYKAVVVVEDVVDSEWQAAVSRWLADSGCLYMMAWGNECSSWHDSVDLANQEQFEFGDIPDDKFIMTTWHGDEPLSEVIWFAKYSAHHPNLEIENVLILHIGAAKRPNEFEDLYRNA